MDPTLQPLPKRVRIVRDARRLMTEQKFKEAYTALEPLLPDNKRDGEALFLAAMCAEALGHHPKAAALARRSLKIHEHPDALLVLARSERLAGNTEEAARLCKKAIDKAPKALPPLAQLAGTYEEAGRTDEARAILEPIVADYQSRAEPLPPVIRSEWAKLLVQLKRHDEALAHLDGLLALPGAPDPLRRAQFHLRAKALDRAARYEDAFAAAVQANALGKVTFDPDLYTDQVSALVDIWSADNIARFPRAKCDSPIPVFVAGMPRSGTSLIDQIIDAHPKAAGVSELSSIEQFAMQLSSAYDPDKEPPACFGTMGEHAWTRAARDYVRQITKIAPGADRIVNKALGNNKLVGLIARLFPNTRIIHAVRDPKDVAISCFMGGFNNNMHAYTTQIDWTAHTWAQSIRMMHHWQSVLDVPILTVHYEHLVADPDTQFPRIIDFLGLEWDDACRAFHTSRRTVRTLSYDQVNRPLYTSSSGRHTKYAPCIAGIDFPPYDPDATDPLAPTRAHLGLA